MAILHFLIIGLGTGWPEFLRSLEVTDFEEFPDLAAAFRAVKLKRLPMTETALCFIHTEPARLVKEEYTQYNVLVYQSSHPLGEVLVDMQTHYSARLLSDLTRV